MWQFAAGLYLVYLADGMLRLAAIFGFAGGTLMLLLGGIIGDWVDRNGRMKVVIVSLFVQNISVALCATSVCMVLVYHNHIYDGSHVAIRVVVEGVIIGLALVAFLASMAYKIAIEKDWIVVVSGDDKFKLTNLNAVTRAIDLSCKILAPTVAGLIMSYSHIIAAIFIAVWNVISVVCEYALLRRVYKLVPKLAVKGSSEEGESKEYEMKALNCSSGDVKEPLKVSESDKMLDENQTEIASNGKIIGEAEQSLQDNCLKRSSKYTDEVSDVESGRKNKKKKNRCLQLAIDPFVTLAVGWKTYVSQKVVLSGLALALLYMTVLGFDYVTTGYIYANGVKEAYVGVSMALAGVTGIIGTVVFSHLNKRLGLERTGLIAFAAEILCLMLTVASVWAPGTVFDPTFSHKPNCSVTTINATTTPNPVENLSYNIDASEDTRVRRDVKTMVESHQAQLPAENLQIFEQLQLGRDFTFIRSVVPVCYADFGESSQRMRRDLNSVGSHQGPEATSANLGGEQQPQALALQSLDQNKDVNNDCTKSKATVSVILFLVGIVTSRIGLWMADLVVTQLFQENVPELERGIVNGVQNSLNMLMDMIKNALVIALPSVETFGILIILSFIFIVSAGGLFIGHVIKNDKSVFLCGDKPKSKPAIVDQVEVVADENKLPVA